MWKKKKNKRNLFSLPKISKNKPQDQPHKRRHLSSDTSRLKEKLRSSLPYFFHGEKPCLMIMNQMYYTPKILSLNRHTRELDKDESLILIRLRKGRPTLGRCPYFVYVIVDGKKPWGQFLHIESFSFCCTKEGFQQVASKGRLDEIKSHPNKKSNFKTFLIFLWH